MPKGATIINNQEFNSGAQVMLPQSLVTAELEGMYGSKVLQDMQQIINLYDVYDHGADYTADSGLDYTPADLKYKKAKALLDKEARFLFSKPPDFYVDVDPGETSAEKKAAKDAAAVYQTLVDNVLKANQFPKILLRACKDCFIGKRVALMYNINEITGKIGISFLPSLEFVYDVDPNDANTLTKIVAFYGLNDAKSKSDQRIYKKKYELKNGLCYYTEEVYDGMGNVVETISPETATKFNFIPAWVIVNEALTGDLLGNSEIELLQDYESWYNRMNGADLDAERKGMNPIRWTRDMSPESTKGLSISAGAYWDLSTDQNAADGVTGEVGVLDSPMSYSAALDTTLKRVENGMYEQVAVPNVSPDAMKGVVSSGKTLKAIYWDLIVRCDEKMLEWRPALQFMAECIIEGARMYPGVLGTYIDEPLPDQPYDIRVDNQYSLPEDEQEEKQIDLAEVNAQTMSKRSYMKKWRNLTDEEADEELRQIAIERQLLESSYFNPGGEPPNNPKQVQNDQEQNQQEEQNPEQEEPQEEELTE